MPSIFSRFADIISSNINAMLDKAENPAKMLKLMIGEMEDTLAEIKAACAEVMADQSRLKRQMKSVDEHKELWQSRAILAAQKNKDDLAREALLEKRTFEQELNSLTNQLTEMDILVARYRQEIEQLEERLTQAREKDKMLALKQEKAHKSLKASEKIKKYDLAAAGLRLEQIDRRIDKLEAKADLEFSTRQKQKEPSEREKAFMELDDSLERELAALKNELE